MDGIRDAFPERASELIQRYADADLSDVIRNIDHWNCEFSDLASSLSEAELKKLWSSASIRIYRNKENRKSRTGEPIDPNEKNIILLFYLLNNVWAKWCHSSPAGFLSGAREILIRTAALRKQAGDHWESINEAVISGLKRLLDCSLSNSLSISEIAGDEKLDFQNGRLFFFASTEYELSHLLRCYKSAPEQLMSLWMLKDKLSWAQRDVFDKEWQIQVRRHWQIIKESCFEQLKSLMNHSSYSNQARDWISALPPSVDETQWLDWCIDEFARRLATSDGIRFGAISSRYWNECIQQFRCWSGYAARKMFDATESSEESVPFDTVRNMLAPDSDLSVADRVCIALTFLIREHTRLTGIRDRPSGEEIRVFEEQQKYVGLLDAGRTILWIFARLQDLPTHHYGHRAVWSEFGPDEKAAWRAEMAQAVSELPEIRQGLAEFLLWQIRNERFSNNLYSEIELMVFALCTTEDDVGVLVRHKNHTSRLVRVRAAALLARLGLAAGSSPFVPLPDDGVTIAAANQALSLTGHGELPYRTWMQDKAVERIIASSVQRVEHDFSAGYEREWRLDEEMHLSTLLTELRGALTRSNGVFDALAAQGVGVAPRIDLSFRQIAKHEEGSPGVGSDRFSADVAFIVRVTDNGKQVTQRATLVQCKKLKAYDNGSWKRTFDVERQQCDDLIRQTEAAFYMFLTPALIGNEVWILPARTVRNLADLHGSKGTLPHTPTYYASRSLAQWVTYDLFGLWTGDERKVLVKKAQGTEPGYAPRFVVSVTIHRNPTHDEAPNRRG